MELDLEVSADRSQMFRVFGNLARNSVEAGADTISIGACKSEQEIEIEIADNGSGLPARAGESVQTIRGLGEGRWRWPRIDLGP